MHPNQFFKVMPLFVAVIFLLSACTIGVSTGPTASTGGGTATDGGVYKSTNQGMNWTQATLIQGVGRQRNFNVADILSLAIDPSDNKAIYAGSLANGLFYSYDSAASWQIATALGQVSVTNIAVDQADKCLIYVTAANKVFKSDDCSRNWSIVYFDNDPNVSITSLAIDNLNGNNVFIGTSRGEIIKSADKGSSWRTLDRFNNSVGKIVISPVNSKIIFVGTIGRGVFRSSDGGANWLSLSDKLKAFDNSQYFRDLVVVPADKTSVFLANNYGLVKSTDNGETWSKLELITPEKEAIINALAVNPTNVKEIYYVTNTTFYRSLDGGKTWSSKKLPTNRAGWSLVIDPVNPSVLYLAAKKLR